MPKNHFKPFPEACGDLQVNCCRNPHCPSYGIARNEGKVSQPVLNREDQPVKYTLTGSAHELCLCCHSCRKYFPVKSNAGIIEEYERISAYSKNKAFASCPNLNCENHDKPLNEFNECYYKYGKTELEKQRFQCKICKKTFIVSNNHTKQKYSHLNRSIFVDLVGKKPFNRIIDAENISPKTLYDKISFIEKKCLAFSSHKEFTKLPSLKIERVYLGVDQQFFTVNWRTKTDRRNVILRSIASCDTETGYCFGFNLNYDSKFQQHDVEQEAAACNDVSLPPSYRKLARIWLMDDYNKLTDGEIKRSKIIIDDSSQKEGDLSVYTRPPSNGVQIHSAYTIFGHFLLLSKLLKNVEKVRFALDCDSGMRTSCLSIFKDRVMDRTCDIFEVKGKHDFRIDEMIKMRTANKKLLEDTMLQYGLDHEYQAMQILLGQKLERIYNNKDIHFDKRWVEFPFIHNGDLVKKVRHATDFYEYDFHHLVNLYLKMSLHTTNTLFQLARRLIVLLERPLKTSTVDSMWHIYSAYNPVVIQQLLNIFRTYYNYCRKSKKSKQTPAMRLGLAKGVVDPADILYFGCY